MSEGPKKIGQGGTIKILLSYLWPEGKTGLKYRVIAASVCMVIAKVLNVYVPFLYKRAIDALSLTPTQTVIALPLLIILSYGAARLISAELRQLKRRGEGGTRSRTSPESVVLRAGRDRLPRAISEARAQLPARVSRPASSTASFADRW